MLEQFASSILGAKVFPSPLITPIANVQFRWERLNLGEETPTCRASMRG